MATLSREDILKLAKLARLKLNDKEVEQFAVQLSEILDYVGQLDSVDVDGLEPTFQVTGLTDITRVDEIHDYGYKTEDLLKNAPAMQDSQFKVRKVL